MYASFTLGSPNGLSGFAAAMWFAMNILTQIPRKIEQVTFPVQEVKRQPAKIGSSGSFATLASHHALQG
jgi:hypothetical protein